jgi:rRNA maturation RNase YbeY
MGMPNLNYCNQTTDRLPVSFEWTRFQALIEKEPEKIFKEVSVIILSRDAMRQMNQDYNGGVLSTDILTFTAEEGWGDLFICPKNITLYASIHMVPYEVRWWHLLVHGLTHLKNLDHQTVADAKIFSQDEKKRWDRLTYYIPYLKLWSWDHNYIYQYKGG